MATATATKRPDPRSEEREAALLLRMSKAEREALLEAAARSGTTATALLREYMLRVIREP